MPLPDEVGRAELLVRSRVPAGVSAWETLRSQRASPPRPGLSLVTHARTHTHTQRWYGSRGLSVLRVAGALPTRAHLREETVTGLAKDSRGLGGADIAAAVSVAVADAMRFRANARDRASADAEDLVVASFEAALATSLRESARSRQLHVEPSTAS